MEKNKFKFKNYSIKLDIRTLFIINLFFSIFIFFIQDKSLNGFIIVTALILMILSGLYKKTLQFLILYLFMFFLQKYIFSLSSQSLKIIIGLISYMWMNLLPIIIMGSLMINTIKTNELICVLEKMKISRNFIFSIAVAFRYIPTIKEEITKIRENMKLRGINNNFFSVFIKPIESFEYTFVPLLFRSIKIAEELTMSALIRGVEYEKDRSSFYEVNMKSVDYFILLLIFISFICFFGLNKLEILKGIQ